MLRPFESPIYVTRPVTPDAEQISKKIKEIWESKHLTNNGEQHKELSRRLKKYLHTENISLFNNGTLALLLGLRSLNLKGEVITTPFTFPATVQALDWNNLTPVFCDIEPHTLNIDADKIENLITEKTTAILAVHVFGNPCDVDKIQRVADRYNLKVIYDGAHAFGTFINGKPVSSFGDMTMFSFHATKLFNTIEGGALVFKDRELNGTLNLLKNFGILNQEEVVLSGLNAKMNELQAGIGLEVLKEVEGERKNRHRLKKIYEENLSGIPGIRVITNLENEQSSYQYFVIEVDEELYGRSRDSLQKELEKYNVFTRKYFYPLCSDFDYYRELTAIQKPVLKTAQKKVKQTLSMPYFGELESEAAVIISRLVEELHIKQASLTKI